MTSDHLHIVLLAHHNHLLRNMEIMPEDEFNRRLKAVTKLTASIMKMQRSEQNETQIRAHTRHKWRDVRSSFRSRPRVADRQHPISRASLTLGMRGRKGAKKSEG